MYLMNKAVSCLCFLLATCIAPGQQPQSAASPHGPQVDLAALVKQQFGGTFKIPEKFPTPIVTADFDGDGIEDIAIVARSTEPFPDSFAFKYKVSDPYNTYFGMSNPAVSANFNTEDPQRNFDLLVIFGAGSDAWRAEIPKDKFVMINVPFDDISLGRILIKKNKPPVFVIKTRESQLMDSAIWWDAKKKRWKWEPSGSGAAQ